MRALLKKMSVAFAVLCALAISSAVFAGMKSDGIDKDSPRILKSLWAKYEKAVSSDLPEHAADILQDIISESEDRRLSWDFYHAWDLYVANRENRNWKDSEKFRRMMSEGISDYGDPFLVFFHDAGKWTVSADSLGKYLLSWKDRLASSRNGGFYGKGGKIFNTYVPDAIASNIDDDYEYSLWVLLSRSDLSRDMREKIAGELEKCISGSYPLAAVFEFGEILSLPEKEQKDSMIAFAEKYEGKAVALLAEQLIMHRQFSEMAGNADSDDYAAFRKKCDGFEKRRASFRGREALIADNCTIVKSLADLMDAESLECRVKEGTVTLLTRNLKDVVVSAGRGKDIIYEKTVVNNRKSYYACDTLQVNLPDFDDGEYWIGCRSGKTEYGKVIYEKYTLSVASRTANDGIAVYVTDYMTGKPVENADLELLKKGEVVSVEKDMAISGFAKLPESFMKIIGEKPSEMFFLRCVTDNGDRKRMSRELAVGIHCFQSSDTGSYMRAELLMDRKLYAPGDTVFFKGIVYGASGKRMESCAVELPVRIILRDTERNEVESCNLVTNSFGSVSGRFILPENRRNGYFSLELESGGNVCGMTSLRVEDLVLPAFGITFDEGNDVILSGDTVTVSGKLFSYSGHGMQSAKVSYAVSGRDSLHEGILQIENDGFFELKFRADAEKSGYVNNVRIKVTDATGETQEFSKTVYVTDRLNLNVDVHNGVADASAIRESVNGGFRSLNDRGFSIVSSDTVDLTYNLDLYGRDSGYELPVKYEVKKDGKILLSDRTVAGKRVSVDLGTEKSGKYVIEAVVNGKDGYGKELSDTVEYEILKLKDDADLLNFHVENIFKAVDNGKISLQFGSTSGKIWAVADIYGPGKVLLNSELLFLDGTFSEHGSLANLEYDWRSEWGNEVILQIFYFKNGKSYQYSHRYVRKSDSCRLPLKIVSFENRALPDTEYSVIIKSGVGTECAASVFDVSTERFLPNRWNVFLRNEVPVENIWISRAEGTDGNGRYGFMNSARLGKAATPAFVADEMADDAVMEEETVSGTELFNVAVRKNFSRTLAFEPFLETDENGMTSFKFRTSDALSTYCIQLFAHDRNMNCASAREEILVTLPVKISLLQPSFLYAGDRYILAANVSSNMERSMKGSVIMSVYDGEEYEDAVPLHEDSSSIVIPASGSAESMFEINVPDLSGRNAEMGIKLVFISDDGVVSDGLFVTVPVYPAMQTLRESHSSVLLPGMSEDSLLTELRSRFVNMSSYGAEYRNVLLKDLLADAVTLPEEPVAQDVISLTEYLQMTVLARRILGGEESACDEKFFGVFGKMLSCQNSDGGFGWYEGMKSSPLITAVVLDRISSLRDLNSPMPDAVNDAVTKAVRYLDDRQFSDRMKPDWAGRLTMEQYLSVRTRYFEIPFIPDMGKDDFRQFRKEMIGYLFPDGKRGLDSRILAKARRVKILMNLSADSSGNLIGAWKLDRYSSKRIISSIVDDLSSLVQYAVKHPSGGYYYPNAVMPYRGLMENELYAHSYLCNLFRDASDMIEGNMAFSGKDLKKNEALCKESRQIADGIRLWIMVQKETQHWEEDPAFSEAVATVMDASSDILGTRIISLNGKYSKPFGEIKAAGNGLSIGKKYFKLFSGPEGESRKEIHEGESLSVGDKIVAEYTVHSDENRSFVRVCIPHAASLYTAEPLSGFIWSFRRPAACGSYMFLPQCYRNVKPESVEYMFDILPEEKTVIKEVYHVVRAGTFVEPAPEVECLYSGHYRANGDAGFIIESGK